MAQCSSCNAETVAGARWCGICHANVLDASIGRLASPVRRLGAHFLDIMVPVGAVFTMMMLAGAGGATGNQVAGGIGAIVAAGFFIMYIVWALRLFANGTTPGKRALGMRVVVEDGNSAGFGTMFIREWIGKFISGMIFSLGFIWILFDSDNQGWHDKLMNTYVVKGET